MNKFIHIHVFNPTPRNALPVGWSVTFFTPSNAHDISATKRATEDQLVSKRPDFRGLFGFSKKYEILDFWIFGFFWISGYISATKRATRNPLVLKRPDF